MTVCLKTQIFIWGNRLAMPVRRGHVAPRTTIIETIIRKFDTHGEYVGECYFALALIYD